MLRLRNEPTISTGDYYVELFRREFKMTETVAEIYVPASKIVERNQTVSVKRSSGLINSFLIADRTS